MAAMENRIYTGEEREGYYVQPMRKRIWAVQLDILKKVDTVCKCHGINYYGWYGTLLGAIRHKGFIPWDDDMDLAMLREDYEQFRCHIKESLPKGWEVSEHEPTLIRIFNSDTIHLDQDFLNQFHGCPFKIGIDIFCLDRIPCNMAEEKLQLNLFWAVYCLCINWNLPDEDEQWIEQNKWDYLKEVETLTGYHFNLQHPVKEQLYFLADRIAAMYWDTESDEVANIAELYNSPHCRVPKKCFSKSIMVPFEHTMLPILEDYDLLCRMTYGDNYMTPVQEHSHDYLKKQVEYLRKHFEKTGKTLPEDFNITFN